MFKNVFLNKWFDYVALAILVICINIGFYLNTNDVLFFVLGIIAGGLAIYVLINHKTILLYSLAFCIPISIQSSIGFGSKLNFPSEIICILMLLYVSFKFLLNLKVLKQFVFHPITILLSIDVIWLIVTSFTSIQPDVSFKRTFIRFTYIIVYYYLFNELFRQDLKNIYIVFSLHCLGMIYPIIHATIFHAQFNFSTQGSSMACFPFYNDHTIYGASLAIFFPFVIYNAWLTFKNHNKWLFVLSIVLLLLYSLGMFLSYSRAAWLTLIIAFVVYLIFVFKIKGIYIAVVSLILALSVFVFWNRIIDTMERSKEVSHKNDVGMHLKSVASVKKDVSNAERVNRWKCAWRMFLDKPVFGFGPGNYQFFYGPYQQRRDMTHISTYRGNKGHAHSEYLGYLSETGFFGAFNFLLIIIFTSYYAIKNIYKNTNNTKGILIAVYLGFTTYVIHAWFNGFIESDKIAMPFFVCIAAIVAIDLKLYKKQTNSVL